MSSKFIRAEDGSIHIVFTSQESHVLINLTEQILELLGEGGISTEIDLDPLFQMLGMGGSEQPPEDPVLRRLLPSAYKDEKSASEFRRYTEHGLREKKRAHALAVYEALIPQDEDWDADQPIDRSSIEIRFEESVAMDWLGALNDLRLALAVRLGISKEFKLSSATDGDSHVGGDSGGRSDGGSGGETSSNDQASELHRKYELMTDSDPMKAVYAVYSWLGWLQQSLLELLMTGGDEHQPT
ncbi:MAG: DUF2017 domain-containing protein [Candidatus Nanopelagicaceae bacterium]